MTSAFTTSIPERRMTVPHFKFHPIQLYFMAFHGFSTGFPAQNTSSLCALSHLEFAHVSFLFFQHMTLIMATVTTA